MRASIPGLAAAVGLAWSAASGLSALSLARSSGPDGRSAVEADVVRLAAALPARGAVGYVDLLDDAESARALHVAQYALAPRLVTLEPGAPFVIVRGSPEERAADPRLAGYEPISHGAGLYRVYRRAR